MQTFQTIADLRAASAPTSLESATVLGYYAINDGGGGLFYYDASSTATDDGGTAITPTGVTGAGRWIAVFENDVINFKRLGAKADGTTDNHAILQNYIDSTPTPAKFSMLFPGGNYYFSDSIELVDKEVYFAGESGTVFSFPAGKVGLKVHRYSHVVYPTFERLTIVAKDKISDPDYIYRGCEVFATSTFRDCAFYGFSGHGLVVYGEINNRSGAFIGYDASLSRFENIKSGGNSGHGVWVVGPDANQCHFTQVDVRDNGQWGIWDQSFLGNMWYTCHANNNGAGPYTCVLSTTQSTFENCYSEMYYPNYNTDGSYAKPSRFAGTPTIVIGGLHGAGIDGTPADTATVLSHRNLTPMRFGEHMEAGNNALSFFLPGDTANIHWRFGVLDNEVPYYGQQVTNAVTLRPSLFEGDTMNFLRPDSTYYGRLSSQNIVALKKALIGNRLVMPVNQLSDISGIAAKLQVFAGDKFMNNRYNGTNPEGWICTSPGTYATALSGVTGSQNGPTIVFSNITNLMIGDSVTWDGGVYQLTSRDGTTNGFYTSPAPTGGGTNLPVSFAAPVYKAYGSGSGTTAQRPALSASDAGWQYFDTTLSAVVTWSGSSWI